MPEQREYAQVFYPVKGLNYDTPSTMLANEETPSCDNVIFDRQVIKKSRGGKELLTVPSEDQIMYMNSFNNTLLMHTLTKFYSHSGTTTDRTGLVDFTGDAEDFYSGVVMEDLYIFTNGVDEAKKWDFSAASISALSGLGTIRPAWLVVYGERLNVYRYTDGGNSYPRDVLYSVIGDPEDFAGAGSGEYSLDNILGGDDTIQRAEKLGGYVVVYADNSIALQEYVGDVNVPYRFTLAIPDNGLAAPNALVNINGSLHIFLGTNDIYAYNGGAELVGIGGNVRDELFDTINPENINKSFFSYIPREKKLRLYYPRYDSDTPNAYFEYYLDKKIWSKGTGSYTCSVGYIQPSSITWDASVGSWNDSDDTWNSIANLAEAEIKLLGDSSGVVYTSEDSLNDKGVASVAYWETKDFTTGPGYRRTLASWLSFVFEATGDSVIVSYSTDQGETYTDLATVTLTDTWGFYRLDLVVNSGQIRFKLTNSTLSQTFSVRYFEVGYRRATDLGH